MKYYYPYSTSIGEVFLVEEDGALVALRFTSVQDGTLQETPLIQKAFQELEEYLAGKRKQFTIPLRPKGTLFQQKVWKELQKIPYGTTKSYQAVAILLGDKNKSRAIGSANHRNPLPIFIPCHRVIGKNQQLIGYAFGLSLKKQLLDLEKKNQSL